LNDAYRSGGYESNGIFQLYVDGEKKIDVDDIVFRTRSSDGAKGIDFTSFFGGGSGRYGAKKDEYTLFKNVRLSSSRSNGN
jgi:hypothetical protein